MFQKDKPIRNDKYLSFVRSLGCCITFQHDAVAHHITGLKDSGISTKTSDYNTIPLCPDLHALLHQNPKAWEARFGKQEDILKRVQAMAVRAGALDADYISA